MAEDFGVEDRGHFYDPVGALRDVVVNHLMQVVAAAAMEAPSRGDPTTIKDAQVALFRAVKAADPAHYVRGQYDGYRVDRRRRRRTRRPRRTRRFGSRSTTGAGPGVPFFIRTGKRLPVTQTELRLVFQHPPRLGFAFDRQARAEPARGQARPVDRHPASSSRRTAPNERGAGPIELDMEFADEGGEGPTPYEVLLHAAMIGDSTRFTRQDAVEETWRIMQPLLDAPPPVHPYAPGTGGRRRPTRSSPGTGAGTSRGSRHDRRPPTRSSPQSAAAPSPFPPIADYAFLSNCHTGALVAPDGAIDWLCVPRFDSPSVFGSLLDRQAGFFRFGPFGINHPTARSYEPGTNVLVTTWKTPSGWVVVRDALTMGPSDHEDEITPHTRPPADDDAEHMLVRTVECLDGRVEVELVCEPAFDYGRTPAEWTLVDGGRHAADATGAGQTIRLDSDLALGIEGNRVRARHVLEAGEKAYCALSWAEELAAPDRPSTRRRRGSHDTIRFWRTWLERGAHPRPPLARPDPALGARDQGPDLHADRRDRRRR